MLDCSGIEPGIRGPGSLDGRRAQDPGRDRADGPGQPDRPQGAGRGGRAGWSRGSTSRELDRLAERVIRDAGGVPAFLNYRGYPATLCISVNDVIVHGIPGDRPARGRGTSSGSIAASSTRGTAATPRGPSPWAWSSDEARAAARGDGGGPAPGGRAGAAGRAGAGHRLGGAAPRREPRLLGGAGVHGARHRDLAARGPAGAQLRRARQGAEAEAGDGAGDRADGQRRRERRQDGRRRLDGAHGRRVAVGPLRVLGGGHRRRGPGCWARTGFKNWESGERKDVCPRKKRRSRSRRWWWSRSPTRCSASRWR